VTDVFDIWCAHSQPQETRLKSDSSGGEVYYSRERIEGFVISIVVLMILILLVIPIYLLYHFTADEPQTLHGEVRCIGILLASTLAFSACISLFTRKEPGFVSHPRYGSFLTWISRREKT
jgi:uncharacterized BrkB/YihY/UPF0761 family membrane protein